MSELVTLKQICAELKMDPREARERLRLAVRDTKKTADQTLVLLHQALAWVEESSLLTSVEYSSAAMYRRRVLARLHKDRMIEFDEVGARARVSPKDSAYVEEKIIAPRMGWKK